jgi:hypothetical protein
MADGLCTGDGFTLDGGDTWGAADPAVDAGGDAAGMLVGSVGSDGVGDGVKGADGGTYGGTGSAGRVGVLAKSCSKRGGRPVSSTWPLAHPDETTQCPRGKGVAAG